MQPEAFCFYFCIFLLDHLLSLTQNPLKQLDQTGTKLQRETDEKNENLRYYMCLSIK